MASLLNVDIVSAEGLLYSGKAKFMVASGKMGDLGVTPQHAPLLTYIAPGPIRFILENGTEEVLYLSGGILEVQPEGVTVLADTGVRAKDLDEAAALSAKQEAERRLSTGESTYDHGLAKAELIQAVAQLRTIKELQKSLSRKG